MLAASAGGSSGSPAAGPQSFPFPVPRLRQRAGDVAHDAPDAPATTRSRTRRRIETLVLLLFWLLLFEGALRKWVLPEYSRYLFFVRDPVLLLIYWHALRAQALRGTRLAR